MSERSQVLIGTNGGRCIASVWVSSHGIDWSTEVRQRIYVWYASLLHGPIALINQAGRPAAAAVVVTPIPKR